MVTGNESPARLPGRSSVFEGRAIGGWKFPRGERGGSDAADPVLRISAHSRQATYYIQFLLMKGLELAVPMVIRATTSIWEMKPRTGPVPADPDVPLPW